MLWSIPSGLQGHRQQVEEYLQPGAWLGRVLVAVVSRELFIFRLVDLLHASVEMGSLDVDALSQHQHRTMNQRIA